MSAMVVTIRGGKCRRRKNCKTDQETIATRRLLRSLEATAHDEQNAAALALSWAIGRKLPCNNLRMIAGTLDERRDFEVRLADCELARAERQVVEAKWLRTYKLHGQYAADELSDDRRDALERCRQAILDMATTPVFTQTHLACKKRAIGHVWLNAQGAFYDRLRAAVAEDEARLSAPKRGRR